MFFIQRFYLSKFGFILPAPELLILGGAPEGVEAAEERHRGADADVGLAEVGEDGEDEDGIGMKMEQLDLVHLQDRQEEVGEGRNEAGVESMEKNGVVPLRKPAAGRPHLGDAMLVGVRGRQVAHLRQRRCVDA